MDPLKRALVFIGFMGAGKTTAAKAVASELGVAAVDADHEIERQLGEPIATFFERSGESEFRRVEEQAILQLLEREDVHVLALGGGSLSSERVRDALRRHFVVYLDVDTDTAWQRAGDGKGRPLARDVGRFRDLHEDRRPVYERCADAWLPAAERKTARSALPAILAAAQAEARPRVIWASGASEYPIFFGRGLIDAAFVYPDGGRRFVVTDENVAARHSLRGHWQTAIAAGEQSKTLATAESVLSAMARDGVTRADTVVAVGGGVVGDIGGFCAAVYQRGIPWVGVPTTVVAQVDSAYGGKTGVDLPEGKNYVGAYHAPAAVIVDPSALDTLPSEEYAAGFAEVVKTALIAGGRLWARVRRGGPVDDDVILGCIRTKVDVVAADERDEGRRQVLNLGHTVGHAIEGATGYSRFRHGEAVGLGLLCALRLSGRDDLRSEVAGLLEGQGLPTRMGDVEVDNVADYVQRDKKRTGASVPFVLVEAPGAVTYGNEVDQQTLRAAIEELR